MLKTGNENHDKNINRINRREKEKTIKIISLGVHASGVREGFSGQGISLWSKFVPYTALPALLAHNPLQSPHLKLSRVSKKPHFIFSKLYYHILPFL